MERAPGWLSPVVLVGSSLAAITGSQAFSPATQSPRRSCAVDYPVSFLGIGVRPLHLSHPSSRKMHPKVMLSTLCTSRHLFFTERLPKWRNPRRILPTRVSPASPFNPRYPAPRRQRLYILARGLQRVHMAYHCIGCHRCTCWWLFGRPMGFLFCARLHPTPLGAPVPLEM